MRADTIEPGDVLTDPQTGALVYTVVRSLPDHWRRSVGVGEGIAVLVRYEVDGGTDVRTFAPDQDVPLTRTRPIPGREGANPAAEVADDPEAHGQRPAVSEPSTLEERRAARAALRRAEEAAAEAQDRLHRLRTRATHPGEDAADPAEIAAAEAVYREACQVEDDAALVVDRLDRTRLTEARAEPSYPIPSYGMDAPERPHIGWQDDRSTP